MVCAQNVRKFINMTFRNGAVDNGQWTPWGCRSTPQGWRYSRLLPGAARSGDQKKETDTRSVPFF